MFLPPDHTYDSYDPIHEGRRTRYSNIPSISYTTHDDNGAVFGTYSTKANRDILRQIHAKLRPGGRFILDIYNRDSLDRFLARRQFGKEGVQVVTEYRWSGKRLICSLTYDEGAGTGTFEWRIYTPDEIRELTSALGYRCLIACAWFDEQILPSAEHARMQFVFEREG